MQSLMSMSQNNIDSRLCAQVRKHTEKAEELSVKWIRNMEKKSQK